MCIVSKITATTATTATKPENVVYFPKKVDCIQPSCFHSANDMYMKCINILWRAQTYRLGFLRRKGRFVNRFLRVMKG